MNVLEQETKTGYQLKRETDKEVGQFITSILNGSESVIIDDQIRGFQSFDVSKRKATELDDKQLKEFFAGIRSAPWAAMRGKGRAVHIAIDSEWVFNAETEKNDILCYSYSIRIGDKAFNGVKHTDMAKLIKDCRGK